MRDLSEYCQAVQLTVDEAAKIALSMGDQGHLQAAEIMNFLYAYGCYGFPSGKPNNFGVGNWLCRDGHPSSQQDAVSVIACFSDDVPPIQQVDQHHRIIKAACCNTKDQVIALFAVDLWSRFELALLLLHEARHARHSIGPVLANLDPLDTNPSTHETACWLFTFSLLEAVPSTRQRAWISALHRECAWLIDTGIKAVPNQILYGSSNEYWPELDDAFSHTAHDFVRQSRVALLAIRANMMYWHQRCGYDQASVCHSIIAGHLYKPD